MHFKGLSINICQYLNKHITIVIITSITIIRVCVYL